MTPTLRNLRETFLGGGFDEIGDACGIAVAERSFAIEIRNWAPRRSHIQEWYTQAPDVVNLRWMHDPDKSVPHDDFVQIRRRKRRGNSGSRLIGDAADV